MELNQVYMEFLNHGIFLVCLPSGVEQKVVGLKIMKRFVYVQHLTGFFCFIHINFCC